MHRSRSRPPLPDVVATQGAHLLPPPPSPVFDTYDADFYDSLVRALRLLQEKEFLRPHIYGPHGDDWRIGHTPPDLRPQYNSDDFMVTITPPPPNYRIGDWYKPPTPYSNTGTFTDKLQPVKANAISVSDSSLLPSFSSHDTANAASTAGQLPTQPHTPQSSLHEPSHVIQRSKDPTPTKKRKREVEQTQVLLRESKRSSVMRNPAG